MAKRKYIYFCEVERFGYTLQVIGLTEKEVRDAIINEYVETFQKENGEHPSKSLKYHGETYMDAFLKELFIDKRELGKVEWN